MLELLNNLFRSLLPLWEMSVTAAYAAAVVIVLRLLLKKRAPKQVLCLLWLVVFARLLIPVSLESPLSIVPNTLPGQEYLGPQAPDLPGAGDHITPIVPQNPVQNQPQRQPGNNAVTPGTGSQNPVLSVPEGVSPAGSAPEAPASFHWQAVIAGVWLTGAAALVGYALVSWLRLRRRLYDAIRAEDGAWEHPAVDSPFILGVLRPRIYLPAGLTGQPRQFILCHERAHLRRFDHIVKPVCWTALALHWFNPLAWAAFLLMSRDIESACDEAVVRQLGSEIKADYSCTLLALATGQRFPAPCPLAFDEGDAKGRIRNVLNYRRPAFWAIVVSVAAAALAAVCLLTDPVAAKGSEGDLDLDAAVSQNPDGEPDPDATASHDIDAAVTLPSDNLTDDLLPASQDGTGPAIDPASYTLTLNEYGVSVSITGLDCDSAWWYSQPLNASYDVPEHALGFLDLWQPRFLGEHFDQYYSGCTALYSPEDDPDLVWIHAYDIEAGKYLYCTVDLSTGEITNRKTTASNRENADCKLSNAEMVQAARILAQLIQDASDLYQASLPAPEDGSLPFDVPMKLEFASGAGAWDTVITLHPDGSFEGNYHDMDMGVSGLGYDSTEYVCRFHGRFGDIRQVTDSSWSMTLEELTLDTGHPIGEEWIENGGSYRLRYISSSPYGFDRWDGESMSVPLEPGAQFMFYTPEASGYRPTDELYGFEYTDEDCDSIMYRFWTWMPSSHKIGAWGPDTRLGCYALCSMETGYGFFDLGAWGIG